ncbi:hypothetical protein C4564_03990 [Candidatus Microgenomates bacterium]|nr:MAG: hypothetical protein C4564_03990 [Candidatus Microgenomates bacterium]
MSKRTRYFITAILLSVGFAALGFWDSGNQVSSILILSAATLVLFYWCLWEGLGRNATLITLILPVMYTLGVGMFWFLIPSTLMARLPIIAIYAVGIYGLASIQNIFVVSVIKKIALERAARGVNFVLSLFTSFLLFDAVMSLRADVWLVALLVALISMFAFLQGLWVSRLGNTLQKEIVIYTLVCTYVLSAIALMLYFWPVTVVTGSLGLTVSMYVLLGLAQSKLEGRLFKQTAREYLSIGIFVLIIIFLTTHWRN